MVILLYWGISTSSIILDFKEFHDNRGILIAMFSSPTPLENGILQNSFLSSNLVSNVVLIDQIVDHGTIITDSKEDDYLFLVQWKDNTISDASWITSHDPLHYPLFAFSLVLIYERHFLGDEVLQPRGNDGELI